MLDKYSDINTIKNHPAHKVIVYTIPEKITKSTQKTIIIKKPIKPNLSLDLTKNIPKMPNREQVHLKKLLPNISKSSE
jgi:hypothetical protein